VMSMPVRISQLVEGPAGLIAIGVWAASRSDFPAVRRPSLLLQSSDAQSWRYAWVGDVFGGATIEAIEAGRSGYVALGYLEASPDYESFVWASSDGVTWQKSSWPLDSDFSIPNAMDWGANGVAGFDAGFVAATVRLDEPQELLTPASAWSVDGATWTGTQMLGLRPGIAMIGGMSLTFARLSPSAAMARENAYADTSGSVSWSMAWVTTDGRTWCGAPGIATVWPGTVQTDGHHALAIAVNPDDVEAPMVIGSIRGDLTLNPVGQSGTVPTGYPEMALGPAGLVACDGDGTVFYAGKLAG
jgi:hypothetical protein